jgi:adenosylmethionine-8-amino-7-oxononanoate aminotransferase
MLAPTELLEKDNAHFLHPLHHPSATQSPLIFESGHGIWLRTVDGKEYIDGLAGLWNVLIGHGNTELADAARDQIATLAYCSSYAGSSNLPAIELADRLAGWAYPSLNTTFFTSGGAESNESAFKTVRYYWRRLGKPDKTKVISRQNAYHGITLAAMSATGMSIYWPMFEPRVPGFLHIPPPYPFRFPADQIRPGESIGQAAARALEEAILREGPETVGAFIAEPVQGAGGVIVPPDDYFPAIRAICDRYEVLFIADEVITGFGRTGDWFALNRWGVQPDIMSFAKGITSGYQPLGGIQISDKIRDVIVNAPPNERWMHAYTYSGHPTCCAVANKNLEILQRLDVAENARVQGKRLLEGLQALQAEFDVIGDARGLGLMAAIEFADRETKQPAQIGEKVRKACLERGLFTRVIGSDILSFAPPLVISAEEIDLVLQIVGEALAETTGQ